MNCPRRSSMTPAVFRSARTNVRTAIWLSCIERRRLVNPLDNSDNGTDWSCERRSETPEKLACIRICLADPTHWYSRSMVLYSRRKTDLPPQSRLTGTDSRRLLWKVKLRARCFIC